MGRCNQDVAFALKNRPLARMALVMMVLLLAQQLAVSLKEMAEHRSHQMGFFFILYGLSILPPLSKHRQLGAAIHLYPSRLTFLRSQVWQSEVELWKEATVRNPEVGEVGWPGMLTALQMTLNLPLPPFSAAYNWIQTIWTAGTIRHYLCGNRTVR